MQEPRPEAQEGAEVATLLVRRHLELGNLFIHSFICLFISLNIIQ